MLSNQRKNIGVFLQRSINEFQNLLCQGIISEATERGYNVAVFSDYGKYGDNINHFIGDQALFRLPPYEQFDGVILALDTMEELDSRELIVNEVRKRCSCPVVSIRELVDGANNLLVDNKTCLNEMVTHFVEKHGFTRLCCMSGPENRWDAVERMECFKNKMAEYQLPVGEHQLFWGDYWTNMGKEACDWFLEGQAEMPQAIICANDHMAMAVTSELLGRGIRVPDDICVSGYDGLVDALYFIPSITTMRVPFRKMGSKAVEIIDEKQDCPEQVEDVLFQAEVIPRESCGCTRIGETESMFARRQQYERNQVEHNREIQFDYFSIHMGECNTYAEISNRLYKYRSNISGLKDYALCLKKDLRDGEVDDRFTDQMEMRIGVKDDKDLGDTCYIFPREELLPSEMIDDSPQCWYFSTIHYQNFCYGYEAYQFKSPEITGQLYFKWNVILGNKIHDLLVERRMAGLISQLEVMSERDLLTAMYNRRGWERRAVPMFRAAKETGTTIFLSVVDLDGMKNINDNFGHSEGDFALCKICDVIRKACGARCVCARTGGDEFIVAAREITEEEGASYMERVDALLDEFNRSGEKEYDIHASYGYICKVPAEEDTMESFTKYSDDKMYEHKIKNKRRRGEPLR